MDVDNATCNRSLTLEMQRVILSISTAIGVMGVLLGLTALGLLFFFQLYKYPSQRISLYLLFSGLFHATVLTLFVTGITGNYDEDLELCKAMGFLLQYSGWILLVLTTYVTIYIAVLVLGRKQVLWWMELIGVLTCLVFPLLFSWIPFIHNTYGLSGAWCWIRILDRECQYLEAGFLEQIFLWHIPFTILLIGNTTVIISVFIIICRKAFMKTEEQDPVVKEEMRKYKDALKKTLPLLAYPIIFQFFSSFAIINRIRRAVTDSVDFPVWIIHAITLPTWGLFAAVTYIIYLILKKKYKKSSIREAWRSWKHCLKRPTHNQQNREMTDRVMETCAYTKAGIYTAHNPTQYDMPHDYDITFEQ